MGTTIELDVGPVAHGGFCVARHQGRAVFVRHALPGERVRAVVTEGRERDRFWRADAVTVLTASPDRVEEPCPYARPGRCGGCDWQHAALPAQRRLKAEVVAEQLQRLAGITWPVEVEAVPGDEDGLGWRTRVQYAVDAEGRLGLRRHRSHDVVAVDHCRIAHPDVHGVGATARHWGGVSGVEVIAVPGGEERLVVLRPDGPGARVRVPDLDARVSVLVAGEEGVTRLRGRTWLRETAAGRDWRVSGSGFWQVHPGAADTLVGAVLEGLAPAPGERAVDLYAGVGLFAGALAQRLGQGADVVAVESDPRAAADARRNLHDLPGVSILAERVDRALPLLGAADLVVLDPPRAGAGRPVVEGIGALGPRAVAYVACDPAALARDLATFAGLGYALASLRAYDLFPMTAHVECVAVLTRDGAPGPVANP